MEQKNSGLIAVIAVFIGNFKTELSDLSRSIYHL